MSSSTTKIRRAAGEAHSTRDMTAQILDATAALNDAEIESALYRAMEQLMDAQLRARPCHACSE